jgi:alpha-galactosidase
MKEKIVLIGAGSAMFTKGLVADFIRRDEEVEIALVDIDPAALRVAERVASKMVAARRAPIQVCAATDRRDVLRGATAVICTVGVGGRRAWEQDVFVPRKYNVYQPVGDSVMPGGTSRALRMIPAMVAIAQDVLDLAPSALFFNYGNPMAPVCRAIRKATGANVIGLCHGVFDVGKFLARQLGVQPARFNYSAVGMNHMTWFVEARVDGRDAMPKLHEIARQKLADLSDRRLEDGGYAPRDLEEISPFSWQLFELFGAFPAVLDRHVSEFWPRLYGKQGSYFGRTLGTEVHSLEGTIAWGDKIFEQMCADAESPEPFGDDWFAAMSGEHEQVVNIITSIRRDEGRIYSANLPNHGQVPNLPAEAVLESPAVADGAGLRAIQQPPLPAGLVGTLATRLAWVETTVEAALEGSRAKFIQALLLDGSVDSIEVATQLAGDLLAVQSRYLPQFHM